ncbi:GPP34 family phosphoprotein [Streptomyces sp. NPDC001922]|uniref:GOLPH3/VPS74 family protein n=1 Tax=Streptomyces sp. NPDC001922 TaxID=3364624 RepID=UPI00368AAE80
METTLSEQIMLLSLDDATGTPRLQVQCEFAISSASVLELALAGRVRSEGDHLVVTDSAPLGIPALDGTLQRIAAQSEREDAQAWIFRLRKPAVDDARRALLEKGVIREERTRRWGIFPAHRYPEADGTVESRLRRTLAAVVLEGQEPDARTAALVVLLHSGGLHELVFGEADRAAARKRMSELTEGHWAEPVMHQLVNSVHLALTTTAAATTAAVVNTVV